jgi:hypothetical protein
MNCPFLKCLSPDLLHITHKGCNIVVKVKVAHCYGPAYGRQLTVTPDRNPWPGREIL